MSTNTQPRPWHETHDNIVTLTAWMAEHGYPASELAEAVAKPWKYGDEFVIAKEEEAVQS